MKFGVAVLVLAAAAVAVTAAERVGTLNLVRGVNQRTKLWTASLSSPVARMSLEDVRAQLLGVPDPRLFHAGFERVNYTAAEHAAAPAAYDPREQYPQCRSMRMIRDQAWCGSCWAFGAVSSISDRICIKEGRDVILSSQDMLACSGAGGCNGGMPYSAYRYWVSTGVVTEDCAPYSFESCDHHIPGSTNPCPSGYGPTPKCERTCKNGHSWESDKHRGKKAYAVAGEADIMTELATRGPCEAVIAVYEDFMVYTSGIYHHVTGRLAGYHAIKILGYGEENGTKYWTLANSWNEHWGEKGYFRMLRGSDECGVESDLTCGEL